MPKPANPNHQNLFAQQQLVTRAQRQQRNGHKSFTLWFTGLSGAGKSTLANQVDNWLFNQQYQAYLLDGDNTRLGLNRDLGFTNQHRHENLRRVAEVCKLFNDAGIICIASFISPFEADRQNARQIIGADSFIEVFIDADLQTCIARDPKGLYQLAMAGKISHFTGIDSPFEAPTQPQLQVNTNQLNIADAVATITTYLQQQNWLANKLPVANY